MRRATREFLTRPEAVELWDEMLAKIASGDLLTAQCKKRNLIFFEVRKWIDAHPERAAELAAARRYFAETLAENVITVANGKGDVGRDKLKVHAYMKLAECWNPDQFGNKRQVNVNIHGDWGEELRRSRQRTIDVQAVPEVETRDEVEASPAIEPTTTLPAECPT